MRRAGRRALLAVVPLAVLLAACGSDGDAAEPAGDDSARTTSTAAPALPAGAEDLVGRFAHFDVVAYEDDAMRTLIISTGFSDLEVRDGELWNQMTFCHADTVVDQDVDVSISDAATQAIRPVATPVEVTEVDGALHLSRPATPTPIGIDLEDPANESLPTDPNDPRIVDADGDGHPGVTSTVRVTDDFTGEIYLARREIFAYDLVQEDPDRLEGTITDRSEQLILGASDPAFLTPAQWVQVDDPDRNPVIWQRVDPSWDCDRLAQERDRLFPPNPTTDW
ncbi:MAG: hypothetical protein R2746_04665 [Acidimicrobiales bacterium]